MNKVRIKAKDFFEILKSHDASMWQIFAQMIDGQEKEIIFVDENATELFSYFLPATLEKLKEDQQRFAAEYAEKLARHN